MLRDFVNIVAIATYYYYHRQRFEFVIFCYNDIHVDRNESEVNKKSTLMFTVTCLRVVGHTHDAAKTTKRNELHSEDHRSKKEQEKSMKSCLYTNKLRCSLQR